MSEKGPTVPDFRKKIEDSYRTSSYTKRFQFSSYVVGGLLDFNLFMTRSLDTQDSLSRDFSKKLLSPLPGLSLVSDVTVLCYTNYLRNCTGEQPKSYANRHYQHVIRSKLPTPLLPRHSRSLNGFRPESTLRTTSQVWKPEVHDSGKGGMSLFSHSSLPVV